MSKGYNNFMSKKGFHPGSMANQKRIHEAEMQAEAKRKHDEETLAQYLREQELLEQKSLVSKESKDKLSLNFMYEAPPGIKKLDEGKTDKVEWKGSDKLTAGLSSTSATTEGHSIGKNNLSKIANPSEKGSGISLEWKRERSTGRPRPTVSTKQELKKEVDVKREISSPSEAVIAKQEPKVELEWTRKNSKKFQAEKTGSRSDGDFTVNTKRIKKELR